MLVGCSQDFFCAVSFLCARITNSPQSDLAFLFDKVPVAPVNALSFPKLDLATCLKEEILKGLTFKVMDIFMWTVSTTILQWPNSCNKLPIFSGNRTGETQESTTTDQWHHILSVELYQYTRDFFGSPQGKQLS